MDFFPSSSLLQYLGAAWDLLMRGEGIELPREQALMEPQREMTCLGWAKFGEKEEQSYVLNINYYHIIPCFLS